MLVGGIAAGPVLYAATTRSALAQECRSPSAVFSGNLSQHPETNDCTAGQTPAVWKQWFRAWRVLQIDQPTIQLPTAGNGWADDLSQSAGAQPLSDFFPVGEALPLARIKGTPCSATAPTSNFDFGASFASIFGPTYADALDPVVPAMRGDNPNCNGAPRTYLVDPLRPISLWEALAFPSVIGSDGGFASIVAAAYMNALLYPKYPVKAGQVVHMWNDGMSSGYCPTSGCSQPWDKEQIMDYLLSTFQGPG